MWPIQEQPEAACGDGEEKKRPSYFVIAIVTQTLPVCLQAWSAAPGSLISCAIKPSTGDHGSCDSGYIEDSVLVSSKIKHFSLK